MGFTTMAIACVAVAGCEQNLVQGPIDVTLEGDRLRFAVCETISAESLSIQYRGKSFGEDWELVLEQRGNSSVRSGDVFDASSGIDGLKTVVEREYALSEPSELLIQILGETGSVTASFTVDPERLTEGVWLRSDESVSATPCTGYS